MSEPTIIQPQAISIVTGAFEELGAAVMRLDPKALKRFRASQPQRVQLLQQAARDAPNTAPLVNQLLMPMLQSQNKIASAAASAAASRRVKDSADLIETATHIVPICIDGLTTANSLTAEVSTPFSGQPWRYLAMYAKSSSIGVRLTNFSLAGLNHVVTSNVSYGSAPTNPGIDFAMFAADLQASTTPWFRYRPWGLKRSGVIRPDGKIGITIENRSGATQTAFMALMVQASPCGEGSTYDVSRGGVYERRSKQSRLFFKKLLGFSLFQ